MIEIEEKQGIIPQGEPVITDHPYFWVDYAPGDETQPYYVPREINVEGYPDDEIFNLSSNGATVSVNAPLVNTEVGARSLIGPRSRIEDTSIGSDVRIGRDVNVENATIMDRARVGDGAIIEAEVTLFPGSRIGIGATIESGSNILENQTVADYAYITPEVIQAPGTQNVIRSPKLL